MEEGIREGQGEGRNKGREEEREGGRCPQPLPADLSLKTKL